MSIFGKKSKDDTSIFPTQEFCWQMMAEKNSVLFVSKSRLDFILLQEKLFTMGYAWSMGETQPLYVGQWCTKALLLANGKITKCDFNYKQDNLVRWDDIREKAESSLARKLRSGELVTFHASSEEEAAAIQEKLFAMGCKWQGTGDVKVSLLDELSKGTLHVRGGILSWSDPRENFKSRHSLAELMELPDNSFISKDFKAASAIKPLSAEEKLAALESRVAELEKENADLRRENAALKEQLKPGTIEKVAYFPGRHSSLKNGGG
jgi:hypothetical protein